MRGYGIEVEVPEGWEGKIYRRPEGTPILHAANFPLPAEDGDFGSEALRHMANGGVFLSLGEYDRVLADTGLFGDQGSPWPFVAADYSHRVLQRARPGQMGLQRFFTVARRAFCLFVVVGASSRLDAREPAARANRVLRSVAIAPDG